MGPTNTIAVLKAVGKLELESHCLEDLACDEVLVRISKVCICGVDDSCVFEGQVGYMNVEMPCGVGQSCMGVVVKCGADVSDLSKDDRVTIEPGTPCRCCEMCKCGYYNLCEESNCYIAEDISGGCLAKYCKRKAHLIHKLPDCVCDEGGAMVQPLSVALHACRRAEVWAGCKVLVTGAGPMGLLCVGVAKALGATNIMVTDKYENRLKMAVEMGADNTMLMNGESAESMAKMMKEQMDCEPEISFECSGTQEGLCFCIYATQTGGKIMQVGICDKDVTLPLCHATMKEIDIMGLCCSANCFPLAIDMIANDMVCVNKLISKSYEMSACQEAFEYYYGNYDCICCMVDCN